MASDVRPWKRLRTSEDHSASGPPAIADVIRLVKRLRISEDGSASVIAATVDDVGPRKNLHASEDKFEYYDVFINHRGPDTKTGFVGFLYEGLKFAGLWPFLDCKSIDKGEDSWICIEHAIKTTPIAVIIFSEEYAQSEWCLRELHLILETPGVKVLPVFYKIEPWEVRYVEKGQLSKGFAKLKERHDAAFIDMWRVDLERASKLNGWEYEKEDKRLEKDLVSEIVERLFEWANKTLPLDIGEHVIGVDMVAQEIIQKLDQRRSISMLGLWGFGGIGKSTLARELYNRLRTRFVASTFVEDVTEKVMQGGIAKVQGRILKDLCKSESDEIDDKSRGKVVLEERLYKKRILVVLDDVCENVEMEYLISRKMLSEGSMCIMTSRDKRTLQRGESFDVTSEMYVHDVQLLNYEDSKRVFTSFAIGSGFKSDRELEELVSSITKACSGVPLVLKVCGALLKGEDDMNIWKDVLKNLRCGSIMDEEKIFRCLRISYDALQTQQKEMFLDIACALLGQSKDMAIKVWRSQGWSAHLGVRSLVEKALVTMDEFGCFGMHDHLRDMGRAIVKEEEVREGVIRRLWDPESLKLLRTNEVLPKFLQTLVIYEASNDKMEHSSIHLDLCRLKHLRIMRCQLDSKTTLSLPKNLKWFSLDQQGSRHTLPSFHSIPESSELVIWDAKGSNYEVLCESIGSASMLQVFNLRSNYSICRLPESFGSLGNLRTISLQRSRIEDLPESFGRLRSLEVLKMGGCSNLKKLPDSFGGLETLKTLSLENTGLEGLPESFGRLRSLEDLNMRGCSNLKKLPDSFGGLGTLKTLSSQNTGIEGLPESFGRLRSLEVLKMGGCSNLKKLPDSFGGLETLRTLHLWNSRIEGLPESFGRLRSLEVLKMGGCSNLKKLPDSFGGLETLKTLSLENTGLEGLPESFGRLRSLEVLNMEGCSNLKKLPDSFGGLETLKTLSLENTGLEGLPESFGRLRSLEVLNMWGCSNLKKLPDSFGGLETLKTLCFSGSGIEGLPESFGRLSSLEFLNMWRCSNLKKRPDSFRKLETLKTLFLQITGIEGLPDTYGRFRSLANLKMDGCSNLKKLPDSFGRLETLKTLYLRNTGIEGLPESFGRLRSLEDLDMEGCSNLKKLPDSFGGLEALRILSLRDSGIEGLLESFASLSELTTLDLNGCSNLKKLPESFGGLGALRDLDLEKSGIEGLPESFTSLTSLEVLDLSGCQNLMRLPDAFWDLRALLKVSFDGSGVEHWPVSFEKVCSSEEFNSYYQIWHAKKDNL